MDGCVGSWVVVGGMYGWMFRYVVGGFMYGCVGTRWLLDGRMDGCVFKWLLDLWMDVSVGGWCLDEYVVDGWWIFGLMCLYVCGGWWKVWMGVSVSGWLLYGWMCR